MYRTRNEKIGIAVDVIVGAVLAGLVIVIIIL